MSSPDSRPAKGFSRYLPAIARILFGLPFLVFGLNGLFNFIPPPSTPIAPEAAAFAEALMKTGYMMQLIGLTMLVAGAFLVVNRFVPLALALLAPFLVNSLAFHFRLEHTGLPMALVFAGFELYLAWVYRKAFAPMLAARVSVA